MQAGQQWAHRRPNRANPDSLHPDTWPWYYGRPRPNVNRTIHPFNHSLYQRCPTFFTVQCGYAMDSSTYPTHSVPHMCVPSVYSARKSEENLQSNPPHPPFFFLFFLFLGTVDQTKLLTTLPSARSQYKYGSRSTPTRSSPPKMQKQQPSSSSSSKSPQRIVRRQVVHV